MPDPLICIARQAIDACAAEPLAERAAAALERGGRAHLVGAGKASVQMGRGVISALGGAIASALLITKDGHANGGLPRGEIRYAGHPEPDGRSSAAGRALRQRLGLVMPPDRIIAVISGGASALIATPAPGLAREHLAAATRALIAGGKAIDDINVVRKHLTLASGGRLAVAAYPGAVDVLVVSDVLGDDLSAIGSGPFAPDKSDFAQAVAIARDVASFPAPALALLERGVLGQIPETPKPGAGCFKGVTHHLLASPSLLAESARRAAQKLGYDDLCSLPPTGQDVAAVADVLVQRASGMSPGQLLISGGEPTVLLPSRPGKGGRNQQLALLMAKRFADLAACGGSGDVRFLAIGSDGTDGPTDAAGALVDCGTFRALERQGIDPHEALRRADAYEPLEAVGALVRTGPTGTNVLDLHLLTRRREAAANNDSRPSYVA